MLLIHEEASIELSEQRQIYSITSINAAKMQKMIEMPAVIAAHALYLAELVEVDAAQGGAEVAERDHSEVNVPKLHDRDRQAAGRVVCCCVDMYMTQKIK